MKPGYNRRKAYHQRKPWAKFLCWARRRCGSTDKRWKPYYLDKGVLAPLTVKDAEELWHRDGAAQMKKPSLDRIETGKPGETRKHYEKENCRFVEWLFNVRRPHEAKGQHEGPAPQFA